MTAGLARSTADVATDLAASILATWQTVGPRLSVQPPRIGRVRQQAESAFSDWKGWDRLVEPVAADLAASAPGVADVAPLYLRDLGRQIGVDAANGLALAMDLQIAKGIHPDVAWARALAGYGLDEKEMRPYILAAIRVDKDGSTALLTASTKAAQQAVLAHAQRIGDREATAWATLPAPSPVAKKFDPTQNRDRNGKWTADPQAGAMAAHLNADTNLYPEYDFLEAFQAMLDQADGPSDREDQIASRREFEDKFGDAGKKLAVAIDDWISYPGVSRARHVEHGTHDRNPISRMRQRKLTAQHQILIDALNAAPVTTAPLYRGASYADTTALRRGAVLNLPLTSFSQTRVGAERFAWLNFWDRKKTPVQFEVAPGAQALNLTPLTTKGMTPNEWISHGRFKIVSAHTRKQLLHYDASDTEGKEHDVLVVRLRYLPTDRTVSKAGFDPNEPRAQGQWVRTAGAPRKPVKEAELDTEAPSETDSLFPPQTSLFGGTSQFGGSQFGGSQFAAAQTSQFADTSLFSGPSLFPPKPKRRQVVQHSLFFFGGPTPGEEPDLPEPLFSPTPQSNWRADSVPEDTGKPAAGYGMYMGTQDYLNDYFHAGLGDQSAMAAPSGYINFGQVASQFDRTNRSASQWKATGPHGAQPKTTGGGGGRKGTEPTEEMRDYLTAERDRMKIQMPDFSSPWDAAAGMEGVDPDDWSEIAAQAVKLWTPTFDNLLDFVDDLTPEDLAIVANRAGYPDGISEARIMTALADQWAMADAGAVKRKEDGLKYNPNILYATTDYLVWNRPDLLGTGGEDLVATMKARKFNSRELRETAIPDVITFERGLHYEDDASDVHGLYKVTHTVYTSGLADKGANLPPGKIGLRETYVKSVE